MNRKQQMPLIASLIIVSATAGFVSGRGAAVAGAADPLQLASGSTTGIGIVAESGETPEIMKEQADLNVQAYEPEGKEGGDGAYQKTLIDNDKVKVNLVAYKKGFLRPGGLKRRYNTLLVYVDPGRYTITKTATKEGANTPVKGAPDKLAPGSAVFHRKDSIISELRVDEDYRVIYVEMK
jgi:hypothetical protein